MITQVVKLIKYITVNILQHMAIKTDPLMSEKLSELFKLLQQAEEEHAQTEHNVDNITKTKERTQNEQSVKPYLKQKLRSLYKSAIQNADSESKVLRDALFLVVSIRSNLRQRQRKLLASHGLGQNQQTGMRRGALMKILQQSASALPLFIPETRDDEVPPLCGCKPAESSYVAKASDMVAAFVPSPDGDGSKVWVLGEVLQYQPGCGKYEIDDIDEEQKERHTIGKRRVIPLPTMRANPATNPEALFPKDTLVLALYPQTTCFYRAIIDRPPETASDDYMVSFEDSTYTEGYSPPLAVPQRYVIASKEMKK